MAYTYILECKNGEYYVGSTIDMERRLAEHQAGLGGRFTSSHLPILKSIRQSKKLSGVRDNFTVGQEQKKKP